MYRLKLNVSSCSVNNQVIEDHEPRDSDFWGVHLDSLKKDGFIEKMPEVEGDGEEGDDKTPLVKPKPKPKGKGKPAEGEPPSDDEKSGEGDGEEGDDSLESQEGEKGTQE